MMDVIKNISVSVLLGIIINSLSSWMGSHFLLKFLDCNLITLLVALMAINTTTMSVMMTKMSEIKERHKIDFPKTIREMTASIYEQISLICIAVALQIISDSPKMKQLWPNPEFIISSFLVAVFVYAMLILFDTAKGIFVLLENEK
ncbi:MAG: hypothetical protein WC695_08105 [Candidatus Omnitrophota bacterium]